MAEETDFENGIISNFQGLVILTLDCIIMAYRSASIIDI